MQLLQPPHPLGRLGGAGRGCRAEAYCQGKSAIQTRSVSASVTGTGQSLGPGSCVFKLGIPPVRIQRDPQGSMGTLPPAPRTGSLGAAVKSPQAVVGAQGCPQHPRKALEARVPLFSLWDYPLAGPAPGMQLALQNRAPGIGFVLRRSPRGPEDMLWTSTLGPSRKREPFPQPTASEKTLKKSHPLTIQRHGRCLRGRPGPASSVERAAAATRMTTH